jgi:hypothetical protein
MNILVIDPDQYRGDVVHFTERVFSASNESAFSRISQCDGCVMITGMSVLLQLSNVDNVDRTCRGGPCRTIASYSKKNAYNLEITRNVQYIEQDILKQYGRTFDVLDKSVCLNVSESLTRGKIKIANCGNGVGGGGSGDNDGRDDYEYDRDRDHQYTDTGDIDGDNDECYNDETSDKMDESQSQRRISNIVLKISGIWETEFEYGLTYKYYY